MKRSFLKHATLLALISPGLVAARDTKPSIPPTTPTSAPASQVLVQPNMSLSLAKQLADSAQRTCANLGKSIAVTVVDRAGQVVVMQRGDDVGPHNVEASRRKAYTALSTRTPTLEFAHRIDESPNTKALTTMPELLLIGGGMPIRADENVIGAVGVAGGGSPENDESCAIGADASQSSTTK